MVKHPNTHPVGAVDARNFDTRSRVEQMPLEAWSQTNTHITCNSGIFVLRVAAGVRGGRGGVQAAGGHKEPQEPEGYPEYIRRGPRPRQGPTRIQERRISAGLPERGGCVVSRQLTFPDTRACGFGLPGFGLLGLVHRIWFLPDFGFPGTRALFRVFLRCLGVGW